MSIFSRSFAGEEDYARVRDLLIELSGDSGRATYCTVGDLDWWRSTEEDPDSIQKMQIWFDGERVISWAWPSDENSVDLIAHPGYPELVSAMILWSEQDALARSESANLTLETWSYGNDSARNDALRQAGFERSEPEILLRSRSVDGQSSEPLLPAGYTIRDMRNATDEDIERRVEVHRAAFAPSKMTVEKHRRVMAAPTYRPDLDLFMQTEDGSFASFTIVWFDESNKFGLFEPLGTHPDHQRKGLGREIMAEGLRRLAALGATTAYINTGTGNPAANALYEKAGFRLVDENVKWTKTLRKGLEDVSG
jgi:mycothiol synthase